MKKYKVGYTTGVFDMFHVGHLDVLRRAKEQCDYLIVGVNTDELVLHDNNDPPIIPFEDRMRIVDAIKYVDEVVPQSDENMADAWERLHFEAMFVGSDCWSIPLSEKSEQQFNSLGVDIVHLLHIDNVFLTDFEMSCPQITGRIGYTTGVFDMFHIGHLNILKRAKALCDYLIVGVSTDENVQSYKHKTPIISFEQRALIVNSICYVDKVVPQNNMDKYEMWQHLHFDLLFHGDDWKGTSMYDEIEKKLKEVGCKMVFLPHTSGISSSLLRNKI